MIPKYLEQVMIPMALLFP